MICLSYILDGGFLDDDIAFNIELDAVATEVSNDGEETVCRAGKLCALVTEG